MPGMGVSQNLEGIMLLSMAVEDDVHPVALNVWWFAILQWQSDHGGPGSTSGCCRLI